MAVAASSPARAGAETTSSGSTAGTTADAGAAGSPGAGVATFVASARGGRSPAVILIRTQAADAAAEAKQLSQLGLASITVQDPESLGALRVALADLRGRDDVDPARIGVIAEGPGAALAAKLLAREPVITAAVLGNAPAEAGAPLSTLQGARVLLQRGIDTGKATEAVAQRLVTKAPVGTLLYQHPSLRDTAATRERDDWLRDELS